jgi:hypothetical protein
MLQGMKATEDVPGIGLRPGVLADDALLYPAKAASMSSRTVRVRRVCLLAPAHERTNLPRRG